MSFYNSLTSCLRFGSTRLGICIELATFIGTVRRLNIIKRWRIWCLIWVENIPANVTQILFVFIKSGVNPSFKFIYTLYFNSNFISISIFLFIPLRMCQIFFMDFKITIKNGKISFYGRKAKTIFEFCNLWIQLWFICFSWNKDCLSSYLLSRFMLYLS